MAFDASSFDCILVTNYLQTSFPFIKSVKQNGFIIYETFSLGNERFGKPSIPIIYLITTNFLICSRMKCELSHIKMYSFK